MRAKFSYILTTVKDPTRIVETRTSIVVSTNDREELIDKLFKLPIRQGDAQSVLSEADSYYVSHFDDQNGIHYVLETETIDYKI